MSDWKDPVYYTGQWANVQSIDIPIQSESDYSRRALATFAAILYSNPTLESLPKRIAYRHIRRQLSHITCQLNKLGFIGVLKEYKDLGNVFLTSLLWDDQGNPTLGITTRLLESPLKGEIVVLSNTLSKEGLTPKTVSLIRWIYNWHVMLAKIPLSRPDLKGPSVSDWAKRQRINTVADLQAKREVTALHSQPKKAVDLDKEQDLILALRHVVGWLFEFHSDDIVGGKHGPGSTASGDRSVEDKNSSYRRSLQTDQVIQYHPSSVDEIDSSNAYAVLRMVIKDVGALRPITMMPVNLMFAQQALKTVIYHQIDNWMQNASNIICFSDQTISQKLALKGSSDRSLLSPATIDCSFASDLLSLDLVLQLFPKEFVHYLACLRSLGSELPDKSVVEHEMFDGMGSALTFPVQTIVFGAVALLSSMIAKWTLDMGVKVPTRVHHDDRLTGSIDTPYLEIIRDYLSTDGFKNGFYKWSQSIQVFGDDIILPVAAARTAMDILERLGLRVNEHKSFFHHSQMVREACGTFACGGYDITPLRYRVPVVNNNGNYDYAALEGLRMSANRAYLYNYKQVRRLLLKEYRESPIHARGRSLTRKKRVTKTKEGSGIRVDISHFGEPKLLYVQYHKASTDTIGFYSWRTSQFNSYGFYYGDRTKCVTTVAPRTQSRQDEEDAYYLQQQLQNWMFSDMAFFEDHGKIPRGIRLELRNARLVSVTENRPTYRAGRLVIPTSTGQAFQAWEWAPR